MKSISKILAIFFIVMSFMQSSAQIFEQPYPMGFPLKNNPNFIGQAYLYPLTKIAELNTPMANVTFEPGCRNSWHKHSGGQILIATAGVGFYQERGKVAQRLLPGDIVEIAPGVEHWHGAAPDSWFAHIAIECNPGNNEVTWLTPVNDTEYMTAVKSAAPNTPKLTLNNGMKMPQFGLGTFLQGSDEICKNSVLTALKAGYRHIDTAHAYEDERGVGAAVRESGIPREEIWITSKIWPNEYGEGKTLEAIDKMLARLQTDYIDMLYIHQPVGDYVGAWRDMEKAVAAGKVRSLGISNFDYTEEGFKAIVDSMTIKPAALQIECHPYAQRLDMREKVKPYGIAIECWFPLGGAMSNGVLLKDPVIMQIAERHGKTPAQVILRWHIQEGFSVIPGATNPDYIKENIEIFDFQLSEEDMNSIRALNKEQRFFNMPYDELKKYVAGKILED